MLRNSAQMPVLRSCAFSKQDVRQKIPPRKGVEVILLLKPPRVKEEEQKKVAGPKVGPHLGNKKPGRSSG